MISGISAAEWWLIAGIICLIIEFTNLPNIGFLFLGLGAIFNGLILNFYPCFLKYQYIIWLTSSLCFFIILWWSIKLNLYKKTSKTEYSDLVGKEVQVSSEKILPKEMGQVLWSGTIMNAQLINTVMPVTKGETLVITKATGNTLICSPKI
jgi:membrane protein implicated in regulation of membrane protease activity